MKSADRFLLAIIAGIVALVVAALALALMRTPQGYLPDTTPGGVAHNYLLALKQRDSARAYGYLLPDLAGAERPLSMPLSPISTRATAGPSAAKRRRSALAMRRSPATERQSP